jgi:hypothetical protein
MIKRKIIIMLIAIMMLTACTTNKVSVEQRGIKINGVTTSIGAVDDNVKDSNTQSYKYTIFLTNNEIEDLTILSIEPRLNDRLISRVLSEETLVSVNKIIGSQDSLEVTGEIIFDASGLTKEQIIELKPFVEDIKIIQERIIKKKF